MVRGSDVTARVAKMIELVKVYISFCPKSVLFPLAIYPLTYVKTWVIMLTNMY